MKRLLLSLAILLCMPTISHAADVEYPYFREGDWEVGFRGSYNRFKVNAGGESEKIDFFYLDGNISYFLTDNFSVGMNPMWFYLPEVGGIEAYALGAEGNIRYHFQKGDWNIIPYVGAHAGYLFANAEIEGESEDENTNSYGLHAGVKIPINENVYFDTQLKWTDYNLPWEIDIRATQVLLGLNIKF